MILGANRPAVIENIRKLAESGDLNAKAELDDPALSKKEKDELIQEFLKKEQRADMKRKHQIARNIVRHYTSLTNKNTEIRGLEKLEGVHGKAVITSNHFNQLDNTVVKYALSKHDSNPVYTVIEESNLKLPGIFGFLMKNADTIPLTDNYDYLRHEFVSQIQNVLDQNGYVLIYPEQEMWFNYRKPRPGKRGAYYYASQFGVPVISLFTEIRELPTMDNEDFHQVKYIVHVLDPIYPDPDLSVRQNSMAMLAKDDLQRRDAYEKAYGRSLDSEFSYADIAGYVKKES